MFDLPLALPPLPECPFAEVPASTQRLLKRAERHIADRHYSEAIAALRRAIDQGADAYVCTLRIADLECRQQRWWGAVCAAEQAMAMAPNRILAYELLVAISLQAGDYRRAISTSQALIKLMPRQESIYDTLSAIYLQVGDIDAALRVLNTLVRLDPDNATYQYKKGLLFQHKGEVVLAVDAFTLAIQIDPSGSCGAEAQEALETLDAMQLNQVLTLGMEDMVFRIRLLRNPEEAAAERGFLLSEQGNQILGELCHQLLRNSHYSGRPQRYN